MLPPYLLDGPDAVTLLAVTHPGGERLGAAVAAPLADGVGRFDLVVRPEFHRRKVGTALLAERKLAAAGWAGLMTAGVVHQDRPEVAFFPAAGLDPVRRYVTHTTTVAAVQAGADRLLARFADHPHLRGAAAVPLYDLPPADVVRFLLDEFGGVADRFADQLAGREFCDRLSVASVVAGRLTGVVLCRSDGQSYLCELLVAGRAVRPGPTPLYLLVAGARRAPDPGRPLAFEADPEHDSFTWQFAGRIEAARRHTRYVFGCDRAGLAHAARPAERLVGFVAA